MNYLLTFSNGEAAPFETEADARRFAQEHLNPGETAKIEFIGECSLDNSSPMYEQIVISFDRPSDFDVAPRALSLNDFNIIAGPYLLAMQGIGAVLARLDEDSGWDQSNCFDFDPVQHLLDACVDELKAHAKNNQLFYNSIKLEDATTRAFVQNYGDAFIAARREMQGHES